jgi:hypothetical protein
MSNPKVFMFLLFSATKTIGIISLQLQTCNARLQIRARPAVVTDMQSLELK